jgi:AraC family transcriptional regulator
MDSRERFLLGIEHIERHLLEPLRLREAAESADLSPYYYSRLFRILTGQSFGAYVRHRRLTIAAQRLADPDDEIRLIDLAFDCQYDSQEAFTRAFKRTFHRTPGVFRERAMEARQNWLLPFTAESLGHLQEVLDMEPEIQEIAALTIAGVRDRFDQDNKHKIPELWAKRFPLVEGVRGRVGLETYGVCLEAEPESGEFDYIAGVAVEAVHELPEGVVATTIPSQTYAVFTHHMKAPDLHEELQNTMRWIWGTWLAEGPYEYVRAADFERYPPGFEPGQEGGFLEICVPVKARR